MSTLECTLIYENKIYEKTDTKIMELFIMLR